MLADDIPDGQALPDTVYSSERNERLRVLPLTNATVIVLNSSSVQIVVMLDARVVGGLACLFLRVVLRWSCISAICTNGIQIWPQRPSPPSGKLQLPIRRSSLPSLNEIGPACHEISLPRQPHTSPSIQCLVIVSLSENSSGRVKMLAGSSDSIMRSIYY